MNNDFFRKFITLSQENGQTGKSFGTLITERRDGINKFTINISNVRPKVKYCVTLIKSYETNAKFVDILSFESDDYGNASFKEEVNNKKLNNIELNEFNVCVIRIYNTDELITPLVGYFDKKVKWREFYTKPIHKEPKKHIIEQPIEEKPVSTTKPYEFGFNTSSSNAEKDIAKKSTEIEIEAHSNDFKINIPSKYTIKDNIITSTPSTFTTTKNTITTATTTCSSCPHKNSNDNILINKPRKIKLDSVSKKTVHSPILNPIDDFDMQDDNVRYSSLEPEYMLEKLKEEIKNLKNIASSSFEHIEKSAYEDLENLPYSVEGIFDKSEKITPFKNMDNNISWVIIDYSDLLLIEKDSKYTKNPFLRNSYKKFSHFILGKCIEANNVVYMVGVPDFFNHEFERDIRNLGFISFKESNIGVQQGYWLIVL